MVPMATYVILGFTVLVYLLQMISNALTGSDLPLMLGARVTTLILEGQWWRFITPVFLHGSVMHIFFNMYALVSLGTFLEKHFGHRRFVLLYFLAGFTGNVFSFLLTDGNSVGASTAVFGLVAAQGIFFYQNRKLFGSQAKSAISNAVFIIIVNLVIGMSPGIDNWGHVGGLIGGAIFTWFAGPLWQVVGAYPDFRLQDQREARETILGASLTVLIFGILIAMKFISG
jgi:rhomboid protease GluP